MNKSKIIPSDLTYFKEHLDEYCSILHSLALTYIHDETSFYTADDLLQDTLYKAFCALPNTPVQDMLPWLCTILKNTFLTYDARRRKLQTKLDALEKSDEHEWLWGTSTSAYDEPQTALEYMEDSADLDQILKRLRPVDRYVIKVELLKMDRHTAGIWAESLHIQLSPHRDAQRARLKRARDNLSTLVKEKNVTVKDLRRWLAVYHSGKSLSDLFHTNWLGHDDETTKPEWP